MRIMIALCAMTVSVYSEERLLPRGLDAWAVETIERAETHSTLVRQMIDTLDRSNVVVHVETADVMPAGIGGLTRLVAEAAGYRYVRITLARSLAPRQRAAMLGHELQHACELGRAGSWTNSDRDARRAELQVMKELQAKPVIEFNHEHLRSWRRESRTQVPEQ